MKRFLPFLIYMMPLCSVAQDLIVTTDSDTLPCRIQFVAGGEVAFIPQGHTDQIRVLLTQLDSYRWNGNWRTVGGTEQFPALDIPLAASTRAMHEGGNSLGTGGGMLIAAGFAATIGAGVLLTSAIVGDQMDSGAVKGLNGAGFGMLALAGILTVSAGFSIGKGGQDMKRVQLRAAGVQVR
jgi:hypothetical protein